jgi:2-keto-3-deoxy-L-rhamnonate aldolase RhmA
VWPLDPDGEFLLLGIVENVRGINNLPDILRQVKGIGAIWAGPGDLSVSMGLHGNSTHPEVESGVQKILSICQDFGVSCATGTTPAASVETRLEQGFRAQPTTWRAYNSTRSARFWKDPAGMKRVRIRQQALGTPTPTFSW